MIDPSRNLHDHASVTSSQSSASSNKVSAWTNLGKMVAGKPTDEKKQGVKKLRKIVKDKKGINTILAALLMVVIVVVASVMVYAWSTGLLGSLMVTPQTGKEALNIESSTFASNNMNVSLFIRNTGSATVSFTTYYVKDAAGNTWTQASYGFGPTIQPNQVGTANIGISTQCGGCTSSGSGFTAFNTGNSYTVTFVTSRNGQFVFTVVR
jgi:hypothetical protein